jgi:prevent-host-death family protein
MISMDHILPLTDFKRNTTEVREQLKASGQPAVLTVDGRPELVVQDAAAYQKLLEKLEKAEIQAAVQRGLEDMKAGRGQLLEDFDRDFRRRHNLPPRK